MAAAAHDNEREEEAANPYLALRAAKIARNQARLKELGLWKPSHDTGSSSNANNINENAHGRPAASPATQRPAIKRGSGNPGGTVRRSQRLSSSPRSVVDNDIQQQLPTEEADDLNTPKRKRGQAQPHRRPAAPTAAPPRNSARVLALDVPCLLFGTGSSSSSGVLGVPMEFTGKDFVIHESFRRSALFSEDDNADDDDAKSMLAGQQRLSFNKYCGVQEWKNDVLFLWVNLGSFVGAAHVNEFLEHGKYITWFGGTRMHDESPVIQRLLRVGQSFAGITASDGEDKSLSSTVMPRSGIVLWCRRYDDNTPRFSPYTCLGRLAYHSHQPGSSPMVFVWKLLDYEALQQHADPNVRTTFHTMVGGSS